VRFEKETRIEASPSQVFAFHESAGALRRLTPPWESAEVVSGGDSIRPGSRVVIRTKVGPFPIEWEAEHMEYEADRMFADRQVRGPFARWYHRHWFLDDGAGGTLLRDEVDFEPPLGALGMLVGGGFLQKKLDDLFDFRHAETKKIVESGDFTPRGV